MLEYTFKHRCAEDTVTALLEIGAVVFKHEYAEWFTWASGIRSPVYCDIRRILSFPDERSFVVDKLSYYVASCFPDVDVIAGVATGGIALSSLVADRLGLPMVYVRKDAKAHGQQNRIEGSLIQGDKVVVIEDLVSTGGSSESVIQALLEREIEIIGVQAVFSYELTTAIERFQKLNIPFESLTDYATLIRLHSEHIDPLTLGMLEAWNESL